MLIMLDHYGKALKSWNYTRFPIENEYSRPDDLKKNLMKIGVQFLSVPTVTTRPCMCGRKEKENSHFLRLP